MKGIHTYFDPHETMENKHNMKKKTPTTVISGAYLTNFVDFLLDLFFFIIDTYLGSNSSCSKTTKRWALRLGASDSSELFKQDASWTPVPGFLEKADGIALRSVNYPEALALASFLKKGGRMFDGFRFKWEGGKDVSLGILAHLVRWWLGCIITSKTQGI